MSGRNWIAAPRLRGDKLRGNDVTLAGVPGPEWALPSPEGLVVAHT
jgi:hypothetical protein